MLGKGSFGEVFLVKGQNNDMQFAMKILKKDQVVKQNLSKYVQTERNVLSIMNHPFIVKLHYAFQDENKLYLVLQYCPGGDLGKFVIKYGKFTESQARVYLCEVLLALEYLHQNQIIYRDLKPENIVLDEDGHALLTDFGLSKQGASKMVSKSFCGSIAYLAPEMLLHQGHNLSLDWYLFGVLSYELTVGIPPYYSNNRNQLFENIKNGPLKIPRNLSDELKDLIKKLLCRNPSQRLGSKNDAQEIKSHPFFKDVNWSQVYQRQLKTIPIKKETQLNENKTIIDGLLLKTPDKNQDLTLQNWSFVNTANF